MHTLLHADFIEVSLNTFKCVLHWSGSDVSLNDNTFDKSMPVALVKGWFVSDAYYNIVSFFWCNENSNYYSYFYKPYTMQLLITDLMK